MKIAWHDDDAIELAALYASGALTRDERIEFERLLSAGNEAFRAAWRSAEPAMTLLAGGLTPVTPPARVKDALMERIAASDSAERIDQADGEFEQAGPDFARLCDVFVQRDEAAEWTEIGIPGVRMRVLFTDHQRNIQTCLVKVEPGTEFPAHLHTGPEDCYVLEGDVETFGTTLRAGDYFRAPAGSMHGPSRSLTGCLCLVTSSLGDDVLRG